MKKQKYIAREKAALLNLNNTPGIVRLVYSFQNPTHLFFVLTFANHGDLSAYIKFMNLKMAKFYAAELLIAIEGIHRNKIIHRDLKPQNCLLDKHMHLLVADFGSAKLLDEEEKEMNSNSKETNEKHARKASFVGTCLYVSPEILINKPAQYSSDLFSYGCIIYQLLSGYPPFGTLNETEYRIFQQIKNIEYSFPEGFDSQGKDLVENLLKFNPDDRLGAGDIERPEQLYSSIRLHEFFDTINFDELYSQRSPMFVPPELQNKNVFHISEDLETGFGESQLRRILQQELNLSSSSSINSSKFFFNN
jgi:3-phosphoinositide dependent protein kinase-1